jgi:2-aminoethylphosphonate-pyruvate transaminase
MSISLENPYLLLTPGPLSTSGSVKRVMLKDWCTWDSEYNNLVQEIRKRLVYLASAKGNYTSVLMQGSGTFSVEATIGTILPPAGKLLVLSNGAYGERMVRIAEVLRINYSNYHVSEEDRHDVSKLNDLLSSDPAISHVAMVHCETTTGMLNPIHDIAKTIRSHERVFILDAMSSFGGIPLDMERDQIDVLISSANKCIQGVPGFGFVILKSELISGLAGHARSLSLDLYDQWKTMEEEPGKWRFTSPTHTVRAFYQALIELDEEGGIGARFERYRNNQVMLVNGMKRLGFECYLPLTYHSPIITSFKFPNREPFRFNDFYDGLKSFGFVIYPGKVSNAQTFRIGTIGEVYPDDIRRLLNAVEQTLQN